MDNKSEIPTWERVIKQITISLLQIVIVVFVVKKLWNGHIEIKNFDYLYFLSTVIAIFAIVLSVLFYFKSTEQANQFYNTFTEFTNSVSVQLAKIDSGFGEKLNSIENNYKSIVNTGNQEKEKESLESIKQEMELLKKSVDVLKTQFIEENGQTKQRFNKTQVEGINKNIEDLERTIKQAQDKIKGLAEKENEKENIILIRQNVLAYLKQYLIGRFIEQNIAYKELNDYQLRSRINLYLRRTVFFSESFYHDALKSNVIKENRTLSSEAYDELKEMLRSQE